MNRVSGTYENNRVAVYTRKDRHPIIAYTQAKVRKVLDSATYYEDNANEQTQLERLLEDIGNDNYNIVIVGTVLDFMATPDDIESAYEIISNFEDMGIELDSRFEPMLDTASMRRALSVARTIRNWQCYEKIP